jgi:hypothetical protein
MRPRVLFLMLAAALLFVLQPGSVNASLPEFLSSSPQEETAPVPTPVEGQEPELEKSLPGPKDIVERVAIYVFLGWLWLSILVLIYALRLKIRESDRLHDFAYFDTDKKIPKQRT